MFQAFAPYMIIVVVLGVLSLHPMQNALDKATSEFSWPGLHVLNGKGKAPTSETFKLNWLTAAGTLAADLGRAHDDRPAGAPVGRRCASTAGRSRRSSGRW